MNVVPWNILKWWNSWKWIWWWKWYNHEIPETLWDAHWKKINVNIFYDKNDGKMDEVDEYDDEMVIPRIPVIIVFFGGG